MYTLSLQTLSNTVSRQCANDVSPCRIPYYCIKCAGLESACNAHPDQHSNCTEGVTHLETAACAFSVGVCCAWLGGVALIAGIPASPVAVAAGRAGPVVRRKQACRACLMCKSMLSLQLTRLKDSKTVALHVYTPLHHL